MLSHISKFSIHILILLLFNLTTIFSQWLNNKSGDNAYSPLLSIDDILDWTKLYSEIIRGQGADSLNPSKRIWELLPKETQDNILNASQIKHVDQPDKAKFIKSLNEILKRRDFWKEEYFTFVPALEVKTFLYAHRMDLSDAVVESFNRRILEASYPGQISKSNIRAIRTYEELVAVQERNDKVLFEIPGVWGVGIGKGDKELVFVVYTENETTVYLIPETIEDVPVKVLVRKGLAAY